MRENRSKPKARTVTFLLSGMGTVPIGGSKVVYEYANALVNRGWHVRVIHPCIVTREEIDAVRSSFFRRSRRWLGYQRRRITGSYRPDRWFKIDPRVELVCVPTPEACHLLSSDVWVATWWYTAKWVAACPGARVYLIQHLETWCGTEADVMSTWKLPLRKVVISRWLEDVALGLNEPADYVPNGLDFVRFGMDITPEERDPQTVAMLYHTLDWKGSTEGLRALHKAKAAVPGLKVLLFGVPDPPPDLPNWVEYFRNPPQNTLRSIYNRAAIFLSPSWAEGWPLPPAEAMQCGSALAVTDIGGHREYAIHGETALLSPPKDPDGMAANVVRLLQDQTLRLKIAHQGQRHMQQFTWERAVASLNRFWKKRLTR